MPPGQGPTLSVPVSLYAPLMASDSTPHVFISYRHEDAAAVDELCSMLQAAEIPYWRDRDELGPGDMWEMKIKQAIRQGSLVFLACFSQNSHGRAKSYQNEELVIAAEEFRQYAPGHTWLIPVRLDDSKIPYWDLGAGRTLETLQRVDLFGANKMAQYMKLARRLHEMLGSQEASAERLNASIDQMPDEQRWEHVEQRTKEMLLDPQQRIALDGMIEQETGRILQMLTQAHPADGGRVEHDDLLLQAVALAENVHLASTPFYASLIVATRWGVPTQLTVWAHSLRNLAQEATRMHEGYPVLTDLTHLPVMTSVMATAITAVAYTEYEGLRSLAIEPKVTPQRRGQAESILTATDPWWPFSSVGGEEVAEMLARKAKDGQDYADTLAAINHQRGGRLLNPAADWLYHSLRPLFEQSMPDEDTFAHHYDRAEVLLHALGQDAVQQTGTGSHGPQWIGRSAWRSRYLRTDPAQTLKQEILSEGEAWKPLRQGLFGGSSERARAAIEASFGYFDRLRTKYDFRG